MPPDEEEEEEEEDLVNTNGKETTTGDDEESPTTKPSPADTENNNMDGIVKQQKQKNKTKKKKQPPPPPPVMNPKFKDVQDTGAWGEIGKREVYVAVGVFVTIVIVAIAVVLAIVLPGSSSSSSSDVVTVEERTVRTLENVRAEILSNDVTAPLVEGLPDDPAFYKRLLDEGEGSTGGGTPQQQAMTWLLFVDETRDQGRQATVRWALASMYYQLGGPEWVSSEGWLEPIPVCDWEHLVCDTRGVLQQVDMGELNLVGDIPLEIALLGENIQSISFKRNGLTGGIPAAVFASLPRLGMLYLDHNDLTGTVPASLGTLCKYTFDNRSCMDLFSCVCVCGKFRRK
jgi:hypothetical protein